MSNENEWNHAVKLIHSVSEQHNYKDHAPSTDIVYPIAGLPTHMEVSGEGEEASVQGEG